MNYKRLWIGLLDYFVKTRKTGWGKNEIVRLMTDMELEQSRKPEKKGGKRG